MTLESVAYQNTPPFVATSTTSKVAAYSLTSGKTGAVRARLLRFIVLVEDNGVTDEEGQEYMAMTGNTYRPRRRELELSGYIKRSSLRRGTSAGRYAYAYVATAKGLAWFVNEKLTDGKTAHA